jgi:hypothetical protein
MKLLAYLWRCFKWWVHCLWIGKVTPYREEKPYARKYMRKVWAPRLRELGRQVNVWRCTTGPVGELKERAKGYLLIERRLMVAKRRSFLME